MTTETWIALAGALFAGLAVLVTLVVTSVNLGRWGQRLEGQIDTLGGRLDSRIETLGNRLEGRIDALGRRIDVFATWGAGFSKEVSNFFGTVVRLLHRRQAVDDAEFSDVTARMAALGQSAIDALFERERSAANPLTREELARLQGYVNRARAGGRFTPEEVRDYNYLVGILEKEKPTDPGVWPLVALGAFLLGLYVGAGGRRGRE